MEILEPKLGDVVSGDLCCLVNKLCEAATSSYYAVKSCPPTNDRFWRRKAVIARPKDYIGLQLTWQSSKLLDFGRLTSCPQTLAS